MERIAPLAKILAEANGIDWQKLHGTGEGGLIVEQDILNYLSRIMSGEEEPPATPVDAPPPDWTGSVPSADLLKGAGVESDIAAFVEQARPVSPQVPAVPSAPNLEHDAMEFELDDDEVSSTSASIIDVSGAPTIPASPVVPEVHAPAPSTWDWNAPSAAPEVKLPEVQFSAPPVELPAAPAAPSFDLPKFDLPGAAQTPAAPQAPAISATEALGTEALGGGVAAAGLGSLLSRLYHKDEVEVPAAAPSFSAPATSELSDIQFDAPSAPIPQVEMPTFGMPAAAPSVPQVETPVMPDFNRPAAEVRPAGSHTAPAWTAPSEPAWTTPSEPVHSFEPPSLDLHAGAAPTEPAAPSNWDWNAPVTPPTPSEPAAFEAAPMEAAPIEFAPIHETPVHQVVPEPVVHEPVHAEPAHLEPAHVEPVHAEVVHEAPAHAEPVAEPVHVQAEAAPAPIIHEPIIHEPVIHEPVTPEPVADHVETPVTAEPEVTAVPAVETPAEPAPTVVAPVALAPAAPEHPATPAAAQAGEAVWFGTYLRRDANLAPASELHGQLVSALGQDVPLAFLVARAAQRHLDTLGLHHVALHDSQSSRARRVAGHHLHDAVSALDTDHDGTPDLLVVDAAAHGLDDLHYPHTLTLSVGRMHDGHAALTLNGNVDTAQAAQFLTQVADTLEQPLVLVL